MGNIFRKTTRHNLVAAPYALLGTIWGSGGHQTSDDDIDEDFPDGIKLEPSRFVPEEPTMGPLHVEPNVYTPRDDELLIPIKNHSFTARAAVNTPPVTSNNNNNNVSYVKSRSPSPAPLVSSVPGKVLAVRYFDGDVDHEWIDCASKIPEAPDLLNTKSELRDSYDSFCHSVSEFGSRDSINAFSNKPILYEKYGSKINVVRNYDSMGTLDRSPYCAHHPRVQTRRAVKPRGRGRGKGDRWSMPEFRSYCYKKGLDWNGQGSPGQARDGTTEENGEIGFLSIIESGSEESELNSPPTQKKKSSKGSLGRLSKKNSKSSDMDSSSKGSRGSKGKISNRKNSDSENSQTSGFGNFSSDSSSSSISSRELVSGEELHLKNDQALLNLQRTESFLKSVGEEPEPNDDSHDFRQSPPMITTLDLSSINKDNSSEDIRKHLRCSPCTHQSHLGNDSCDMSEESSGIGSHDSSIPASSSETNSIDSASPRDILKSYSKARLKSLERGKLDSNSSCPNSPPHGSVSSKPSLTQSDSGYDGLCPSIEESDEWDSLDCDPNHVIPVCEEDVSYDSIMGLQKSLGVELSSDSDGENSVGSSSITSPRSCKDELGSSLNSVDKDKRCKMLIEEFKNKKKKEDRNTSSSIYRTSHV